MNNELEGKYQRLFEAVVDINGIPLISQLQNIISIVHEDFPEQKGEPIDTPFIFSNVEFTCTNTPNK